nr:zinc finger protein 239-like [Dermacentor andersoni]
MAEESSNEYTPLDLSMKDKATRSTSRDGTQNASSTLGAFTTISDDTLRNQGNTEPRPITDGTCNVDGVTDNGSTICQTRRSIRTIDKAMPSTSRAGMEEASANFEDGATNAPGTGGREQRELCGACGNVSSRRDALHAKEHADDAAHICKVCHQSSVKISKVVEHCRNRTGKKHKCETCSKEFHRADLLTQHYRTHTNERPHKCQMCNKSFRRSSHLDEHKRTHTDERPYNCQLCNKSFRRSNHLDNHKRKHTGEKPYICKTCGKSFAQSATLRTHENTHAKDKRHVCQNCAKSFKNNSALKRHVDSKCGNIAFVCEICDCSFQTNSGLLRHRRKKHVGKMPYECAQCECRFTDKETRDRHVCQKECKM